MLFSSKVDDKTIQYSNYFLSNFKRLQVLIKILHENLNQCHRKVLKLLLHQAIVLFQDILSFIKKKRVEFQRDNIPGQYIQDNITR